MASFFAGGKQKIMLMSPSTWSNGTVY